MEGSLFVQQAKDGKNRVEMLPVFRMGVQVPLYQDNSNKTWQSQGTIILETNFIRIYVLSNIFLFSNIFKHFIPYNCMKNEISEMKQSFGFN